MKPANNAPKNPAGIPVSAVNVIPVAAMDPPTKPTANPGRSAILIAI